jgi:hypothetical protein
MQWSDISFAPSARTLRQFAGLWLVIFALLSCIQAVVRHDPGLAAVFGVLAVAVGLPGLVKPSLIRPVYVGAMLVTFPIGWTVSKLLLACLFYGIFTPVALLFKLIGRDVLCRRHRPATQTYWTVKYMSTDPRSYFRPF